MAYLNVRRQAKDAGISRATYYARRAQGMSHEEALSVPKNRRYITGPTMLEARDFALKAGVLGPAALPARAVFNRLRGDGVPARLAVLVGRQPAVSGHDHARRISELASDQDAVNALTDDGVFVGGLGSLLRNVHLLSGEQTKNALLNLARRLQPNETETVLPK